VLLIGFVVWSVVFNIALVDYLNTRFWSGRSAWLGPLPDPGEFNFYGYIIEYQFEGYSDYSYYYVHWGYNMLNGVMPYSGDFGYLDMDGIVNQNGAYMFPPLTAYLYALGIALEGIIGPGNWGIGLLFAVFGYATILPVYGIAKELSKNPRVGEIAALMYAINPLVLYHIDYIWLNPAPFYFFFFAGFYALLKKRRHTATILIVTAALFKQTAWFLGIPLVIYLLVRARDRKTKVTEEPVLNNYDNGVLGDDGEMKPQAKSFDFLFEYFDFRGFGMSIIVALSYAGAIMLPFILAQPDFLNFWSLALGHFPLANYVEPVPYGNPVRLPMLPIMYDMPQFAELLDIALTTQGPLFFGIVVFAGLMVLLDKYKGEEHVYLRRILFLTMLLMLWTDLAGPRGVFKYYFAMFGPFFAILSSAQMIRGKGEHVPFSASMIWMPILFSLMILLPDRNYYLGYVLLIFISYCLSPLFDRLYGLIKRPFSYLKTHLVGNLRLRFGTVQLHGQTQSLSFKVLRMITIVVSMVCGSALLVLGMSVCFDRLTASLAVIIQSMLLMGAMVFAGMQILSIASNGLLSEQARQSDLDYVVRTLSFTLAALLIIFGIDTYVLSWTVGGLLESQLMVVSSMLLVMWTLGLVIRVANISRLLADIFLILGCAVGAWVWSSLGDVLLMLLGWTCIAGLVIHLLLTIGTVFVQSASVESSGVSVLPKATESMPI